jgi:hypothetical protein
LTAAPFDTLKLARALREANFSAEQAEGAANAIAEAVQTDLVTKSDLQTGLRDLQVRLGEVELRLDGKIAALGAELRGEIAATRTEIAATRAEILKWMFGAIGFQTLVILGAVITLMRVARL